MTDIYTKAVLTVIALALIVIAGRDALRPATAQSPTRVTLDEPIRVTLDGVDRDAFRNLRNSLYPLPVKMQ
jgi:hypothetical protein